MALNTRQIDFVRRVQEFCALGVKMAQLATELDQQFDEEFDDAQDNSLLDETTALEDGYGFASTDVKTAINQTVTEYINFWGGSAVTTREYGKDARRVVNQGSIY